MKLFSKHTPKMRGRIKITIETDAVAMREVATNYKDALKWLTTSPEPIDMFTGFIRQMDRLADIDKK